MSIFGGNSNHDTGPAKTIQIGMRTLTLYTINAGSDVEKIGYRDPASGKAIAAGDVWRYQKDPALFEAEVASQAKFIAEGGGSLHKKVKKVSHALAKAVSDVAKVSKAVNTAAFHPLTVKDKGLALSNASLELIPENLQKTAQLITKLGGYVVAAGTVSYAAGAVSNSGIGSSLGGVASQAKQAYGTFNTIKGLLTTPKKPADEAAYEAPVAVASSNSGGPSTQEILLWVGVALGALSLIYVVRKG